MERNPTPNYNLATLQHAKYSQSSPNQLSIPSYDLSSIPAEVTGKEAQQSFFKPAHNIQEFEHSHQEYTSEPIGTSGFIGKQFQESIKMQAKHVKVVKPLVKGEAPQTAQGNILILRKFNVMAQQNTLVLQNNSGLEEIASVVNTHIASFSNISDWALAMQQEMNNRTSEINCLNGLYENVRANICSIKSY